MLCRLSLAAPSSIQGWFDRLKDEGVDAKLVIADAAPVSVFADEADEDTSGDYGS